MQSKLASAVRQPGVSSGTAAAAVVFAPGTASDRNDDDAGSTNSAQVGRADIATIGLDGEILDDDLSSLGAG